MNSTSVGYNAAATAENSAAFGAGAFAGNVNQVSVGTLSNTYTLAGVTSAASTAAQTASLAAGNINFVTSDSNGNLGALSESSLIAAFGGAGGGGGGSGPCTETADTLRCGAGSVVSGD